MTLDILEVACACGLMESGLAGLAEMRSAFAIGGFNVSLKVPCQAMLVGTGHSSIILMRPLHSEIYYPPV